MGRTTGNSVGHGLLSKDSAFFNPIQIPPNQEFVHLGMVGVFHRHRLRLETMPFGQSLHLIGVVISHEEITTQGFANGEQPFVVNFAVVVEAGAGALAASGVGRVNEKDGVGIVPETGENAERITVDELNALGHVFDVDNPFGNGLGIPPGKNAFAILPVLQDARASVDPA